MDNYLGFKIFMVVDNKAKNVSYVLLKNQQRWLNHVIIYVYVNNVQGLYKLNLIIVQFVGKKYWL